MNGIIFSKWSGPEGIADYIKYKTKCKPYSGAGIKHYKDKKITILKSVENTYFYKDEMNDINNPKYTLFGNNGNQDENEKQFNEPLLNKQKTEHIYLYHIKHFNNKKYYIWYGKYNIIGKNKQKCQGEDRNERDIIVLSLQKIN